MTADRRTLSSLAVLALFVGALGSLAWSWTHVRTSSANFGDREQLDRNHLGAGTVDITLGDNTVVFDVVDMAAGDVRDSRLDVTNQGTLPLRYTVSSATAGGALADVVELAWWTSSDGACAARPPTAAWIRARALPTTAPRALAPGASEILCMSGRLPLSAPSTIQGERLELSFVIHAEHDVEASS